MSVLVSNQPHPLLLHSLNSCQLADRQQEFEALYPAGHAVLLPGVPDDDPPLVSPVSHQSSETACPTLSPASVASGEVFTDDGSNDSEGSDREEAVEPATPRMAPECEKSCDIWCPGSLNPYNMSALKRFLTSPTPQSVGMLQCRVLRDGSGLNALFPKYALELDSALLVLTAQKQMHPKACNYAFSLPEACVCGSEADRNIGKLNPDFRGVEFVAYGAGLNPKKMNTSQPPAMAREELVTVQYNSSLWAPMMSSTRRLSVTIPHTEADGERLICRPTRPESEGLLALKESGQVGRLVDVFKSKEPTWTNGVATLQFGGRVTQASVKNFQLVSEKDPDTLYMQFGRVGSGAFHLDFRFPFSPLQAFAVCLSTFDYKLCCE